MKDVFYAVCDGECVGTINSKYGQILAIFIDEREAQELINKNHESGRKLFMEQVYIQNANK